MNQETIKKLDNLFNSFPDWSHNTDLWIMKMVEVMGEEARKVEYVYNSNFTHPQITPDAMLYIGNFLGLPFCLDLVCPGCIHVLTGKRTGLVDEWEWYGSVEEALEDTYGIHGETQEIISMFDGLWDWPE